MKGIITKNGHYYTLTIKHDGVNLYKQKGFLTVEDAQEILKSKKMEFKEYLPFLKSYPELEGKVIDYIDGITKKKVKIIGCDFHIGITFVYANDTKRYVNCIRGPFSPQGKNIQKKYPEKYNTYTSMFFYAIKSVLTSSYDCNYVRSVSGSGKAANHVSAASCAFGA